MTILVGGRIEGALPQGLDQRWSRLMHDHPLRELVDDGANSGSGG